MTTWSYTNGKRALTATRVERDGRLVWHVQANCAEWAEIVQRHQGCENTDALYFELTKWVLAHHAGKTAQKRKVAS